MGNESWAPFDSEAMSNLIPLLLEDMLDMTAEALLMKISVASQAPSENIGYFQSRSWSSLIIGVHPWTSTYSPVHFLRLLLYCQLLKLSSSPWPRGADSRIDVWWNDCNVTLLFWKSKCKKSLAHPIAKAFIWLEFRKLIACLKLYCMALMAHLQKGGKLPVIIHNQVHQRELKKLKEVSAMDAMQLGKLK